MNIIQRFFGIQTKSCAIQNVIETSVEELKFKPNEMVWLMHDDKPVQAPISEIHLHSLTRKNGIKYYFWHQDFNGGCRKNMWTEDVNKLFKTKQELLNSL